jgi:hypothetical protein
LPVAGGAGGVGRRNAVGKPPAPGTDLGQIGALQVQQRRRDRLGGGPPSVPAQALAQVFERQSFGMALDGGQDAGGQRTVRVVGHG